LVDWNMFKCGNLLDFHVFTWVITKRTMWILWCPLITPGFVILVFTLS
jgi:hypothetical protein